MTGILAHEFMRQAALAGLLSAVACGVVGTLVVVNRLVFLAGGVAHAAYGGIGLAFFLSLPFLPTTIAFTVAAALFMGLMIRRRPGRADTLVGVLWAAGMALGIILVELSPGYKPDLMSYLFGSILTVSEADLWITAGMDVLIVAAALLLYRDFMALALDPDFAESRGAPVARLQGTLLVMVAVTVVLLISVVGLILVIALLTVAPAMAARRAGSLGGMMALAAGLNALYCLAGLWLSYAADISSGAAIIAVAATCYFVDSLAARVRGHAGEGRT